MKSILLLAHDDHGQEARLQVALDITRALEGHLTCLDVSIVPEVVTDYATMGGEALLMADEHENEARNRSRLLPRLQREDVPFDWIDTTGDLADAIRAVAGLVDLVVVNRQLDTALFPNTLDLVGKLVVEHKLPVLAVPEGVRGFRSQGRALVAWDGSSGAEAALRAATPLLRLAGQVTLFHIDDGSMKRPIEEAALYLSRHGVTAEVRSEKTLLERAGTILLAEAKSGRADYVVMGGYGHSRFVESVFGGATERMLTESPIPVFLAHAPTG